MKKIKKLSLVMAYVLVVVLSPSIVYAEMGNPTAFPIMDTAGNVRVTQEIPAIFDGSGSNRDVLAATVFSANSPEEGIQSVAARANPQTGANGFHVAVFVAFALAVVSAVFFLLMHKNQVRREHIYNRFLVRKKRLDTLLD